MDFGLVAPYFGGDFFRDSQYRTQFNGTPFTRVYTQSTLEYPTGEKTLKVSLGSFSAEELKSAGKLDIKVGHVKEGQFTE